MRQKTPLTKEMILELGFEFKGKGIIKKFDEHSCFATNFIPETLEELQSIFFNQIGSPINQ